MDLRVVNLFRHHLKIRDQKGDDQDNLLTEIGKRLSAIAINILHLEPPDEEQLNELLNILATHYSDFSIDEFSVAFEYRVIGKLKNFGADLEHFNKFSPEYVSNVCNSFRRYRSDQLKMDDKIQEQKKEKETPKLEPKSKAEQLSQGNASFETIDNFIRINKKLPLGWNWDQVYYWIKFGLKEVNLSESEVRDFRAGVLLILKAEWRDKRNREKRSDADPMPQTEFEPTEHEIISAMKSIFVKNYFIKKYKLDVQQEILFDPSSESAGKMQSAGKKKTNHNTDEQKDQH